MQSMIRYQRKCYKMFDRNIVAAVLLVFTTLSLAEPLITYNIGLNPEVKKVLGYPPENYLDFDDEAAANGYLTERHYVTTEDGYILTIFRLRDANCTSYHPVPVIVMHGYTLNADIFLVVGTDAGLGYLLAKSCYDVWAGNQRGNNYGRNHTTLNPDKDAAFWDFSMDEMSFYDNSAIIDYILEATSSEKVNHIGYSQGGATILMTLTDRPEYNDKMGVVVGLSPSLIVKNTKSIPIRLIFKVSSLLQGLFTRIGVHEILFKGSLLQTVVELLCQLPVLNPVCTLIFSSFDTYNPGSIAAYTTRRVFSTTLMGVSVKSAVGQQQWLDSGIIAKHDYGSNQNLVVYGSEAPPVYDFGKVTAPVLLITGPNDNMVPTANTQELGTMLPNLIETVLLNDSRWNHLDSMFSSKIPQVSYPVIDECLMQYNN